MNMYACKYSIAHALGKNKLVAMTEEVHLNAFWYSYHNWDEYHSEELKFLKFTRVQTMTMNTLYFSAF